MAIDDELTISYRGYTLLVGDKWVDVWHSGLKVDTIRGNVEHAHRQIDEWMEAR